VGLRQFGVAQSIQYESLQDSRPNDIFLGDMEELAIFGRL
jgi:hypothetical protein